MTKEKTAKVVSVLDLGTNSVRMNIVRIEANGTPALLTQRKEMVQLGAGAFLDNTIKPDAMERTLQTLGQFAAVCKEYHVVQYLAVATSAVRDAANGREFLAEIERQTGIPFYTISGLEEARLIYKGVARGFPPSDTLRFYLDIGGGSCECIVGDSSSYRELDSVKIGCVRLANMFMLDKHGTVSEQEYSEIQNDIRLAMSHTFDRFAPYVLKEMAVSSDLVRCLLQLAKNTDKELPARENCFSYENVCRLARFFCSKTEEERRQIAGMHPKWVKIIIPGIAILQTVMEALGMSCCFVSERGLIDGILQEYLEMHYASAHLPDAGYTQEQSVLKLAKSGKFEEQHARHVADLALRLFDSAKECSLHQFSDYRRQTLYYAGLLHDIGIAISCSGHDMHGYYIVKNYTNLLGFTEKRQLELALLVASHRMKENTCLQNCTEICPDQRRELEMLACFLKIAESLDRSYEQYVDNVYFAVQGDSLNLCIECAVPTCLEQKKMDEGFWLIKKTFPALNALVWKIKE